MIKSKRQGKNINNILTRAKFISSDQDSKSVTRCKRPNCGTCKYLTEGSVYTFKSGKVFQVRENMTCASQNLIYVIKCNGCGEEYIGQTGDTLRARVRVHKQQIRDPSCRCIPLSGHIDSCGGNQTPNFSIFPFYKILSDSDEKRKIKENFFIKLFQPKLNCIRWKLHCPWCKLLLFVIIVDCIDDPLYKCKHDVTI